MPAGTPPHKPSHGLAAALHRYAMVTLAVAGHPAFAVSDVDMRRPGPSFSVETLARLAREWPGARLVFLMGSDTFLDLPTWRTPEQLGTWAALAVGYRASSGFDPEGPAAGAALARLGRRGWVRVPPADPTDPGVIAVGAVLLVETVSLPVSAQDLRRQLAAGESVRYRVPLAVAEYIAQHRIYAELE